MARIQKRRNEQLLRWIRAAAFAIVTGWALSALAFTPAAAAWGIALTSGILALFAPGVAVLLTIIAMGIPMLAGNFLAGAVFLVIGFAAVQYLGQDNGRGFLVIAAAFAGAVFGPAWAVPVLAGYLLGASEGAVASILACLVIEGAGLLLGRANIGVVFAGGAAPALLDFAKAPENLLGFGWLSASLDALDPETLLSTLTQADSKLALIVQPALWAGAAVLVGSLRRPRTDARRLYFAGLGLAGGIVLLAAGDLLLAGLAATPTGPVVTAAITSVIVAAVAVAVWEYVFPPLAVPVQPTAGRTGMSAEDADVDELLRLIATAEDQLAAKHTAQAVVMITDMKSFSKMTEEDGSVVSAKTIQRHRDLLLPVIERFGGKGKSTGGDGLVAAFASATDAVNAAATMQRTLRDHNASHTSERDIVIRIGITSGEVVLDKGGRPFIGAALNLAARVMNLGDGGQAFATKEVLDTAGDIVGVRVADHGSFELKNIAEPVQVREILWAEGQQPTAPALRGE